MTITLFLAALALQSLPAPTLPRWQTIGGGETGSYAVDPESISRSGDEVSALVRIDVTRGERTGARVGGVLRYVYDCRADTLRVEAGDLYDATGRFLGAAPLTSALRTARPVPPGSRDLPNERRRKP